MDNFESDLINEFEDLQFECRKMNRNTTLYQFQDALSTIFNEIREREIQNEHNPISLLYVIFAGHGSHKGAAFSDGRESHIVSELRHILGLRSMNPVPVVINASFCRTRNEPNEVLESPMARIANDHVSFQFFL